MPEHFRACLELQGVVYEKRSIIIGCRDDYMKVDGGYNFSLKWFFCRQQFQKIENSWDIPPVRMSGGIITGIHGHFYWRIAEQPLVAEFDELHIKFRFTQNLEDRIAQVRFQMDDCVFLNWPFSGDHLEWYRPSLGWPEPLSESEEAVKWRSRDLGMIRLDCVPAKAMQE